MNKAVFKIDFKNESITYTNDSDEISLVRFTGKKIELTFVSGSSRLIYGSEYCVLPKKNKEDEIIINTFKKSVIILLGK